MCNSCDNFDDDISDLFGGSQSDYLNTEGKADTSISKTIQVKMHEATCKACSGTGQFRSYTGRVVGQCFKCKGKGKMFYRQSLEQREAAKARRDAKKEEAQRDTRQLVSAWAEANPAEFKWLKAAYGRFEFATSLVDALNRSGSLSEKQLAAVQKIVKQNEERDAAKAERDANSPTIDIQPIIAAFENATNSGLKRPKLFLENFKFSLAPMSGRNAGSIYIVDHEADTYLGKVTDGRLIRSRDCSDEIEQAIIALCADPKAAAIAYGQRTGSCSCCGKALTNSESIDKGIGPICESRFGW